MAQSDVLGIKWVAATADRLDLVDFGTFGQVRWQIFVDPFPADTAVILLSEDLGPQRASAVPVLVPRVVGCHVLHLAITDVLMHPGSVSGLVTLTGVLTVRSAVDDGRKEGHEKPIGSKRFGRLWGWGAPASASQCACGAGVLRVGWARPGASDDGRVRLGQSPSARAHVWIGHQGNGLVAVWARVAE
jgi:hypothetical protein